MPAPRIEVANTLQEFINKVDALMPTDHAPVWFRGVGLATYQLIPSLYRHPTITNIQGLLELEADLLARFRHRSIPFLTWPAASDWEMYFIMQHYGVPTRLLDWSENPFIALYFAISSAERHRVAGAFDQDAAVWVLNTKAWNSKTISPYWKGRVVCLPDNPLEAFKPGAPIAAIGADPVAMAGFHNSKRIVAQRGAFTIFGHIKEPMEVIYDVKGFPVDSLVKISLPAAALREIREGLFRLGYADSMIYPDLDGLGKELKRQYEFEV